MLKYNKIVTHPGGAHKDEFLACAVLVAECGASIYRCDPSPEDLESESVAVVDIGHIHDAEKGNFDHHQFPTDREPLCALSLVLQHLGLYEDARAFCEWLEPAEWFDCRGAVKTARWLGIERDLMFKLNSPIDFTLLKRFGQESVLGPDNAIWQLMRMLGEDLLSYIRGMRSRIDGLEQITQLMELPMGGGVSAQLIFIDRDQELPDDPSQGLAFYIKERGLEESVVAIISPDSRGNGYGLKRFEDHPRIDFNRITSLDSVHFVHSSGFLAKVSETVPERLKDMVAMSVIPE